MANREAGALPPRTLAGVFEALSRRLGRIERRVTETEAQAGRMLPGDWRFESSPGGGVEAVQASTGRRVVVVPDA